MLYTSGRRVSSGAVAKTAATLAIVGGAANLNGAVFLLIAFIGDSARFDNSLAIFTILGALLMAYTLFRGGIQLWRQDEIGRYTLIIATGVAIAIGIVGLAFSITDYEFGLGIFWWSRDDYPIYTSPAFGLVGQMTSLIHKSFLGTAIDLVLPLLILLTATSKYATHWTASRPNHPTHRALTY